MIPWRQEGREGRRLPLQAGWQKLPALACLALCLPACEASSGESDYVVTDSAGVALVTIQGIDRFLEWTAEAVVKIPPAEEEGEGFFGARDVGVFPGERMVVLDGDGKKVLLYDEEGTLLAQYGREGSGPGEFQYPMNLAVAPGSEIHVFDAMNRRLERFDSTLAPLAPDPLTLPFFGGHMDYAGTFLVLPTSDPTDFTDEVEILTAVQEEDTLQVVRYDREDGRSVELQSCGMRLSSIQPIFAPRAAP